MNISDCGMEIDHICTLSTPVALFTFVSGQRRLSHGVTLFMALFTNIRSSWWRYSHLGHLLEQIAEKTSERLY